MDFINFNEHIIKEKINVYLGSEKKRTVILDDGNQYLLKFPDPIREKNREVSYINNAVSEYIGCKIFKQLGFEVQNTILGVYRDEKTGKEKIACACQDIRGVGDELHEAEGIDLELLDEKQNLTFDSIKGLLNRLDNFDAAVGFQEYCDRFIVDALIGNTDRHNGNWGIIENGDTIRIAPVYDCGSSLSPLLSDNELTEKITADNALNVMSVIMDNMGNRLNYRDFLMSGTNGNINLALKKIVPKIDLSQISETINRIPYISQTRKDFYNNLITQRYEQVLLPSLENALGIQKSLEYKQWNASMINKIFTQYIEPFSQLPKTGTTDIFSKNKFGFIKNNGLIFILNKDNAAVGLAYLDKTNLKVCKFVQSLRGMGINIDMENIRKQVKNQPRLSLDDHLKKAHETRQNQTSQTQAQAQAKKSIPKSESLE